MQLLGTNISGLISHCNLHQHPCWEIILNVAGEGTEKVGSLEKRFFPGSITLCPPNIPHVKNAEDASVKWQDIYLKFDDEAKLFPCEPRWLEDDANHTVETIFRLLQGLYYDPAAPRHAVDSLAEAACTLIAHWITDGRKDKITEQIKNEIIQHFSNPEFSVMDAMQGMNYCPDHIRRVFRKDMGMTPTTFLMHTRLAHARQLLGTGGASYSIREISDLSGFYDPEYFCKCFHQLYGCSPRDYRNRK
ncbi:MAG: helix-turn-helix domain-containing protein [Clostridiales bacterium]|nr:helix-turn-helix domain-containing protein [Clostridiales bacterium]